MASLIRAISIGDQSVRFRNRFVRTAKYEQESRCRAVYASYVDDPRASLVREHSRHTHLESCGHRSRCKARSTPGLQRSGTALLSGRELPGDPRARLTHALRPVVDGRSTTRRTRRLTEAPAIGSSPKAAPAAIPICICWLMMLKASRSRTCRHPILAAATRTARTSSRQDRSPCSTCTPPFSRHCRCSSGNAPLRTP